VAVTKGRIVFVSFCTCQTLASCFLVSTFLTDDLLCDYLEQDKTRQEPDPTPQVPNLGPTYTYIHTQPASKDSNRNTQLINDRPTDRPNKPPNFAIEQSYNYTTALHGKKKCLFQHTHSPNSAATPQPLFRATHTTDSKPHSQQATSSRRLRYRLCRRYWRRGGQRLMAGI